MSYKFFAGLYDLKVLTGCQAVRVENVTQLPGEWGSREGQTATTIEEGKAKVVAAVWGTEFIQCLAPLAIVN